MRVWHKALITSPHDELNGGIDQGFAEHAHGMGGYRCDGYGSTTEFFATHFESSRRMQCYDAFLRTHLPSPGPSLSIASGRAVNEMRLVEEGYDIVCSDLAPVCPGPTLALFPGYRFFTWDALSDPLPARPFQAVMCLSFVYLLSPDVLDAFMARVRALLTPGGIFILDSAGAPDNRLSRFLHDVVLPIDAHGECAAFNLRARITGSVERRVVRRKQHGYRYQDAELVAAAERHGLMLEAVEHLDFETEWTRLFVYRRLLSRVTPARAAMLRLGRRIPYVRMFAFRRAA